MSRVGILDNNKCVEEVVMVMVMVAGGLGAVASTSMMMGKESARLGKETRWDERI